MAQHAKLMGPSSSARRILCPGSYVLEGEQPDQPNQASDDGTAMHWVAAECLMNGQSPADFVGRCIDVVDCQDDDVPMRRVQITSDMVDLVKPYIDDVGARPGLKLIERCVDFSRHVVAVDAFGTADAIVFDDDTGALEVHDFKSGYRRVDVVGNTQLMLYALGAIDEVAVLGDVTSLKLVIHQPKVWDRPQEWDCPLDELRAFAETARAATQRCLEAADFSKRGPTWAATYLNPGEDQCTFCKAAGTCPALRGVAAQAMTFDPVKKAAMLDDFDVIDPPAGALLAVTVATEALHQTTPDDLGRLLQLAPLVETWLSAVRAEGDRRLLAGQVVPGFKVVAGRRGARKWVDADAAETELKRMRLKVEEMYDLKLISPTSAEKLAKGDKPAIGPRQWTKLQALVTQAPGAPSVVPVSDPRPALVITPPVDDFEVLPAPEAQGVEALT